VNIHQVSKINLNPELVDCIVFWSKNPKPLLDKLQLLKEYACYFQFTLNPYDSDIETNLPDKNEILDTFKKLSDVIGPQKVIWRYDPILLNKKYTIHWHIDKFYQFAGELKGYTEKATFSFIDFYKKITEPIKFAGMSGITDEEKNSIADNFSQIAKENALCLDTCAEDIDFAEYNIAHARCIDDRLIAKITGCDFIAEKDKNQRLECGCVGSIDIGSYNSCANGCIYCYANYSKAIVVDNCQKHNPLSHLLIAEINNKDIINERKTLNNKILQKELFNNKFS
jgi:hypothetical protein